MITGNHNMSNVISQNPRILIVLENFNIDLGFEEKTVDRVCQDYNINTQLFLAIANLNCNHEQIKLYDIHIALQDLEYILSYLKNSHVYFLNEKIPALKKLIDGKLQMNPDERYTRLIKKFFDDYSREVFEHMNYEDRIVFPYVNKLLAKQNDSTYAMKEFKKHHSDIEIKLTDLKNLLVKYVPPEYDSVIRRKILYMLFELEHDINIHDHIENNLLVPIVEKLELDGDAIG